MNDRQQITELVARWADASNRVDSEAWAATLSDDCVYSMTGGPKRNGRDEIVEYSVEVLGSIEFVLQLVHSGTVEVDGDLATGRWFISEYQGFSEDKGAFVIGVYQDRYVRTADGWKFAERQLDVVYREKRRGDSLGTAFPLPAAKIEDGPSKQSGF